jgi:aspartate/methionine/tyrosine aminotransferase
MAASESELGMSAQRAMNSPYMEFAKLRSAAKFNLASSGVKSYPLAELPAKIEDLEIDPPVGYGYAPLQKRLAKKSGVAPENVVLAAGTSMANHLAMAALIEPGDEIVIEDPTYELLVRTASYVGANVKSFPRRFEQGWAADPDEIKKKLTSKTRLIFLTNLHNPSSALIPRETLAEIGKLAESRRAKVLVDEVYLETMFDNPQRSGFHLGEQFVITSSLTKAYGLSGLRCGWILAEQKLAERIWRLNDLFAASAAHPAERLSVIALDNIKQVEARAKKILDANRRAARAALEGREEVETSIPQSGTTIFPRMRRGSVDKFCEFLRDKYETSVAPGHFFGAPQHFRIGLGGDPEMTVRALERVASALKEFNPH